MVNTVTDLAITGTGITGTGRGYVFGRYGGKNELRYGRFGKKYAGQGYQKGYNRKLFYDEEEQDPSRYYPVKVGAYQRGKYKKCMDLASFNIVNTTASTESVDYNTAEDLAITSSERMAIKTDFADMVA